MSKALVALMPAEIASSLLHDSSLKQQKCRSEEGGERQQSINDSAAGGRGYATEEHCPHGVAAG
jgi:hypothetical protein